MLKKQTGYEYLLVTDFLSEGLWEFCNLIFRKKNCKRDIYGTILSYGNFKENEHKFLFLGFFIMEE